MVLVRDEGVDFWGINNLVGQCMSPDPSFPLAKAPPVLTDRVALGTRMLPHDKN